jgi:hypothetical protein
VDRAAIVLRLGAFGLQFTLQLLSDLEHFGRMSDGDGSASRECACGKTTVASNLLATENSVSESKSGATRGSSLTPRWSTWPLAFRAAVRQNKTTGERLVFLMFQGAHGGRSRESDAGEEKLLGVKSAICDFEFWRDKRPDDGASRLAMATAFWQWGNPTTSRWTRWYLRSLERLSIPARNASMVSLCARSAEKKKGSREPPRPKNGDSEAWGKGQVEFGAACELGGNLTSGTNRRLRWYKSTFIDFQYTVEYFVS